MPNGISEAVLSIQVNPPANLSRIQARVFRLGKHLMYIEQEQVKHGQKTYWLKKRIEIITREEIDRARKCLG